MCERFSAEISCARLRRPSVSRGKVEGSAATGAFAESSESSADYTGRLEAGVARLCGQDARAPTRPLQPREGPRVTLFNVTRGPRGVDSTVNYRRFCSFWPSL